MADVTIEDIRAARSRIDDESVVTRTPIEISRSLSSMCDGTVRLKMEHLQRTGSFKTRGAYNKMQRVVEEGGPTHAVAASAGNHAQGVALAATKSGLDSTIVMPNDAPQAKVDATSEYGAEVILHGRNFQAAMDHAQEMADEDSVFVHAYDDEDIVAGQGTLGLEIYEQVPEVDTVIVPIGGGGLIGGISTALKAVAPDIRVVGVQAEDAATVPQSLDKGIPVDHENPDTIADGIATGGISELTLSLIEENVDKVVTVGDDEIAEAILVLLQRAKQLVEGAGAASVAGMLSDDLNVTDETVVPLLCGGNIDMSMLETVLQHAMADMYQLLQLKIHIDDRPGKMAEISEIMAEQDANIRTVRHERAVEDLGVGEAYLIFRVVASGESHAEQIISAIQDAGYDVAREN
ncbi:threonine ammonia-lyase [Salinarchaeum sp. IM2453]|uniref:threonine ammonia-lyase n=1 Tax=Salinarchaeum sp. IM2453 TaxID=2862870 RepID=UPI001C835D04|nr:threonine ammonia-lyase [Salinarchaeum sp. IM2453]QZA89672.1 threonine ammonia-lyase [Salinarchaeum sp. IM2453]